METWKAIPSFENYEVSDAGGVRSVDRVDSYGRHRKGRPLSQVTQKSGHIAVAIFSNGQRRRALVHVLVLETFVGPRPKGMDGCHWNDIPNDNRLSNLRWDTRSANMLDSVRNGTHVMASRTHCPQGHEYTPENTYLYPQGSRACNACRSAYRERNIERRRAYGREYMRAKRSNKEQAA